MCNYVAQLVFRNKVAKNGAALYLERVAQLLKSLATLRDKVAGVTSV